MNEQQTQQILDLVQSGINSLSAQLGVTVPQLWAVLIRQQYVRVVQTVVFFSLCMLALLALCLYLRRERKKDKDFDLMENPLSSMVAMLILMLSVVSLILLCFEVPGRLINPEYYAAQEIASFVQNK